MWSKIKRPKYQLLLVFQPKKRQWSNKHIRNKETEKNEDLSCYRAKDTASPRGLQPLNSTKPCHVHRHSSHPHPIPNQPNPLILPSSISRYIADLDLIPYTKSPYCRKPSSRSHLSLFLSFYFVAITYHNFLRAFPPGAVVCRPLASPPIIYLASFHTSYVTSM